MTLCSHPQFKSSARRKLSLMAHLFLWVQLGVRVWPLHLRCLSQCFITNGHLRRHWFEAGWHCSALQSLKVFLQCLYRQPRRLTCHEQWHLEVLALLKLAHHVANGTLEWVALLWNTTDTSSGPCTFYFFGALAVLNTLAPSSCLSPSLFSIETVKNMFFIYRSRIITNIYI